MAPRPPAPTRARSKPLSAKDARKQLRTLQSIDAHRSTWRMRSFQFFGIKNCLSLWDELRRIPELPDDGRLFLAKHGEAMQGKQLSVIVKLAIERANLERFQTTHPNAACHLFRHACATHMLEGGADIRFIQALLGHADLSTTEVYTQVSIGKLKAVHTATHPARLEARSQARQASNADALDPDPQPSADALLRALEQEGSEAVDER